MRRSHFNLSVVVCACLAACLPASAAITGESVQQIITDAKVWSGAGRVAVDCKDNQVVVSTFRDRAETDRDCKIDTVLVLRNILKADPNITRLTVRFYEPLKEHEYKQIEVRQSDIAAFGSGLVDNEKLLSGISITSGYDVPEVVPGPLSEARAAAKLHIDRLQKKGVGVSAYMQLFSAVEQLATKADVEAKADEIEKNSAKKDGSGAVAAADGATVPDTQAVVGKASDATMDALRNALNLLMEKLDDQEKTAQELKTAHTAPGVPPQGATTTSASVPVSGPGPGTDGFSKVENLGSFSPTEGPYLLDRILIARKLSQLARQRVPIQSYLTVWHRMDANANRRLSGAVKIDVDNFFTLLGLTPISEEQRNRTTLLKVHN